MIIKKYQGATQAEAVKKAQDELGKDAVVLNVKSIKQKGIFQFFKPATIEVTVALEEEKIINKKIEEPVAKISEAKNNFQAIVDEKVVNFSSTEKPVIKEKEDNAGLERRLSDLQNLLERQMEVKPNQEQVEKELEAQKSETSVYAQLIYKTLLDMEVDEKYINQFIGEIELIQNKDLTIDHVLSNIYQRMILKLGQAKIISESKKKPKIVYFIGPTGVGKTTTLAKIASKFHVEGNKKIVMLTADTYRIAAAEQLKTYANILGVPFQVIYSSNEIGSIVDQYKNYDFILVDTAGHSHKNKEQTNDVGELIHSLDDKYEKEVFLVISAATKYSDLIKIVDAYQDILEFNLIFTKLDETTSLGNILNIKMYSNKELSYVTSGQNVPDDIEVFDAQNLVKQLLGGQ